jgi:hypothetical protein
MEEWDLFYYSVVTFRISVNGVVRWKLQFVEFAADLFQLRAPFLTFLCIVKNALKFTKNTVVILRFYSCGCETCKYLNLLKTKRKPIYLRNQSVPRWKLFPPWL